MSTRKKSFEEIMDDLAVADMLKKVKIPQPTDFDFNLKAMLCMNNFFPIVETIVNIDRQKTYSGSECYVVTNDSGQIVWRDYQKNDVFRREPNPAPNFKRKWKVVIIKENVDEEKWRANIYFRIGRFLCNVTSIFLKMRRPYIAPYADSTIQRVLAETHLLLAAHN